MTSDFIHERVDEVRRYSASKYEFVAGVRRLRKILPLIGYPADVRRIALAARIHQQMAWFLVHSGRCASASEEARIGRNLWRTAHQESASPEYATGFVEASLIGSNAWLLSRQPKTALEILDVAKDAAESIGASLGSDHYRQRGVGPAAAPRGSTSRTEFCKGRRDDGEASRRHPRPEQLLLTGATLPAAYSM